MRFSPARQNRRIELGQGQVPLGRRQSGISAGRRHRAVFSRSQAHRQHAADDPINEAELRSLTNGLPSRTNVCTRRMRTCGPQGGSPGLDPGSAFGISPRVRIAGEFPQADGDPICDALRLAVSAFHFLGPPSSSFLARTASSGFAEVLAASPCANLDAERNEFDGRLGQAVDRFLLVGRVIGFRQQPGINEPLEPIRENI